MFNLFSLLENETLKTFSILYIYIYIYIYIYKYIYIIYSVIYKDANADINLVELKFAKMRR